MDSIISFFAVMWGEKFFKLQAGEHKEKLKIRGIMNLPWLWSQSGFESVRLALISLFNWQLVQ